MKRRKTKAAIRGQTRKPKNETGGARATILSFLKRNDGGLVAEVAKFLRITYEGARLYMAQLESEGLVQKSNQRTARVGAGRPVAHYILTAEGDRLFPKHYDKLTVTLIDALVEQLGPQALKQVLGYIVDKRVDEWAPRLRRASLEKRVEAMQSIYGEGDSFMSAEIGSDGVRLIERNCPFLDVALQRPTLCSLTVCTLQRLLGFKVVREERFQAGHGRCVFRVLTDQPIDARRFRFEVEPDLVKAAG